MKPSGVLSAALMDAIRQSHVLLSVVSAGALEPLHRGDDWVRREIAAALQLGEPMMPVIQDNAPLPTADQLPHDI